MSFQENRTGARKKMVPSRYRTAAQADKSVHLKVSKNEQDLSVSGNSSQTQGKTSTPTSKTEHMDIPSFNVSVVCKTKALDVTSIKEKTGLKLEKNKNCTINKAAVGMKNMSRNSKNEDCYDEEIAEAEIDLLYTSYLQAVYLNCEANKSLKERTSNALKTLNLLYTLVVQQLNKIKAKKLRSDIYSNVIKTHKHFKKQEEILAPIFDMNNDLKEKYEDLSKAFNISNNILHVKNVAIPESDQEVEVIIQILDKISKFLSAFFEVISNTDNIISFSNHVKKLAETEGLLVEALQSNMDLILEATELALTEATLALSC